MPQWRTPFGYQCKRLALCIFTACALLPAIPAFSQTTRARPKKPRAVQKGAPAPIPKPTPYYILPSPKPTPRAVVPGPAPMVPVLPTTPTQQPTVPFPSRNYSPQVPIHPVAAPKPYVEPKPYAGLDRYYVLLGIGGRSNQLTQLDPSEKDKSKTDVTFGLTDVLAAGWGTVRFYDFYFNTHYVYSQDWGTTYDQLSERFFKRWFKDFKSENFAFPTKSLLRNHEFTLDSRYVVGPVQAGLLTRLWWTRVGSTAFGSKEEVENTTTLVVGENFVPYIGYRHGRFYQGEFAMPFRTEINREDELASNKTYDFQLRGRGRVFSFLFNNRFNFQNIRSILYASAFLYEFKYNAIQSDKTRFGLNLSLDFPVVWRLRASPKFSFYQDSFILNRIRIAKENPEVKRKDVALSYGFLGYADFNKRHRVKAEFAIESVESTIREHNSNQVIISFGYSWAYPTTANVVRKTQRFKDDVYSEEY